MGVYLPDVKRLGMAADLSVAPEGTEVALRIEVLDACGLEHLDGVPLDDPSIANPQAGLRTAMTVFGQVVYAASGLITQNPVRLGGLPRGTDLAIAVLPPTSASSADVPLLATAPLALGMMRACGKPVSPQDGWPMGSLIWEGWLPLSLCSREGSALTEGAFGDARIRVSVLLEEQEQLSLDVDDLEPQRVAEPQATMGSSCLSSPMHSLYSEALPTPCMEKAQSFRLEKSPEVSDEAQPARPPRSPAMSSLRAAASEAADDAEAEHQRTGSGQACTGDIEQAAMQVVAASSLPLGQPASPSAASAAAEPIAVAAPIPPSVEGPRVQPNHMGASAVSVPVALSVTAPVSNGNRSIKGVAVAVSAEPVAASAGPGVGNAASSLSSTAGCAVQSARTTVGSDRASSALGQEAVPTEWNTAVASTAGASSGTGSSAGIVVGTAPSTREAALQLENTRLRSELESSRQDAETLRNRQEEDHQHVQEKLRELEVEVRSRWQKRVSELEAEVVALKQSLVAASGGNAVTTGTSAGDADAYAMSQVQPTATVAAYSSSYMPTVGGVGRSGSGPAGHHPPASQTPVLQWPEFSDPNADGPLIEGPRLGPAPEACLQTPLRINSPSALANSPTLPSLGSPEPSWPVPQLGTNVASFAGSSIQSPAGFHPAAQRVCLDAAAAAVANMTAPGGLQPPPGLKVKGLGPLHLQQIDFLDRSPLPRFPETPNDSAASSARAPMAAISGKAATPASGTLMTSPEKRRDSRPPSPPRPSPPPPPSRPSPTATVPMFREEVAPIPVSVEYAGSSLCTTPGTARPASPEWREQMALRNDPSVVLKHRSQSVPIMARPTKGQADEKGLLGFFEAFGGLYTQLVQGTKCTGPDALAVNERLVEIDLSAEFPPERRAAQVDLLAQAAPNHKTRM